MKQFYVKKAKNQKNKEIATNVQLLRGLLQSKSHYGAFSHETHSSNQKFIYGQRSKQTILNLHYTIQSIKRAIFLIHKILRGKRSVHHNTHKILIIGNTPTTLFFGQSPLFASTQLEFLSEDWVGGFLTNPLLLQDRLKNVRLIVALNTIQDDWLIQAATKINLPLIAITNTHIRSDSIEYPIFLNTRNIQSTFFFLFLLNKSLTT